jgi:polyphosphate glucokinase
MLFLGLGTGLGSAMIVDGAFQPMELAHLPYKKGCTYEAYVGRAGLKRLRKKKWRRHVADVVKQLKTTLEVDYVVLCGGNARLLKKLPLEFDWETTRTYFEVGISYGQNFFNRSSPDRISH